MHVVARETANLLLHLMDPLFSSNTSTEQPTQINP